MKIASALLIGNRSVSCGATDVYEVHVRIESIA
jgi:hypothetical protein